MSHFLRTRLFVVVVVFAVIVVVVVFNEVKYKLLNLSSSDFFSIV